MTWHDLQSARFRTDIEVPWPWGIQHLSSAQNGSMVKWSRAQYSAPGLKLPGQQLSCLTWRCITVGTNDMESRISWWFTISPCMSPKCCSLLQALNLSHCVLNPCSIVWFQPCYSGQSSFLITSNLFQYLGIYLLMFLEHLEVIFRKQRQRAMGASLCLPVVIATSAIFALVMTVCVDSHVSRCIWELRCYSLVHLPPPISNSTRS